MSHMSDVKCWRSEGDVAEGVDAEEVDVGDEEDEELDGAKSAARTCSAWAMSVVFFASNASRYTVLASSAALAASSNVFASSA